MSVGHQFAFFSLQCGLDELVGYYVIQQCTSQRKENVGTVSLASIMHVNSRLTVLCIADRSLTIRRTFAREWKWNGLLCFVVSLK